MESWCDEKMRREKKVKKQKCPLKLFRQTVVDDDGGKKNFFYILKTPVQMNSAIHKKRIHFFSLYNNVNSGMGRQGETISNKNLFK